ncbi:MAG: hypothetical protein U0K83_04175 [Bacteroidales bacterium]|nr:hypothetical protein [Bacteroidales bacterium]
MIKRLIVFLIRYRLGLKKGQRFRFANQKTDNVYYFTADKLIKIPEDKRIVSRAEKSLVSLNWLLSDECEVEVIRDGSE